MFPRRHHSSRAPSLSPTPLPGRWDSSISVDRKKSGWRRKNLYLASIPTYYGFRSREHSLDRPSFKQTCHAVEGSRCGGVGCDEIVVREHQQQHQQQHGSLPHSGPVSHHSSPGTSSGLGPGWSEDQREDRTISRARAPSRARGEISSDEGGERHTLPRGGGGGHEPKVAEWGEVDLFLKRMVLSLFMWCTHSFWHLKLSTISFPLAAHISLLNIIWSPSVSLTEWVTQTGL